MKVDGKILTNVENIKEGIVKKVSVLFLVVFLTIILSGCSKGDFIELSEDESNAIAQYSAYLLLKYDNNKVDDMRLLDKQEVIDIREKEKEEAAPTAVPTEEPEPVVTDTPEPEITDVPEDSTENTETLPIPTEAVTSTCSSISEVMECKDFSVNYSSINIYDSYKSENEAFALTAPKGKKLCIVDFSIENLLEEDKVFNSTDYKVNYKLVCENGKSHSSEISLLANDLLYYNSVIKKGSSVTASVVFYVEPEEVPASVEVFEKERFIINLQ